LSRIFGRKCHDCNGCHKACHGCHRHACNGGCHAACTGSAAPAEKKPELKPAPAPAPAPKPAPEKKASLDVPGTETVVFSDDAVSYASTPVIIYSRN
jgi:hypothetical protein